MAVAMSMEVSGRQLESVPKNENAIAGCHLGGEAYHGPSRIFIREHFLYPRHSLSYKGNLQFASMLLLLLV
jgi:hypothetical protein